MSDVIIGSGAAGLGCVETLRRLDTQREITVVAPESDRRPYSRPMLYYALAGKIPRERIYLRPENHFDALKVSFLPGRLAGIDTEAKTIRLDTGVSLRYDNLVICAGGIPRFPDIPGVDKQGVFGFRNLDDMEGIVDYAGKVKKAVILGGGNIGLQAAEGLTHRGVSCTVVVKSPTLLSQLADFDTGELFRRHIEANGVEVKTGVDAVEIRGGERVESVALDDGSVIPCGMVIAGKGVRPNLEALNNSDIETDWGIIADDYLVTSALGVYAAGDAAEVRDRLTGKRTTVGIWPAAFEQGQYAGWNIMGHRRRYPGALRMNSSEFFGLNLISLGIVNPRNPGDYDIYTKSLNERHYYKLIMQANRLVGAILVGDLKGAGALNSLIKCGVDVSEILDDLKEGAVDFGKVSSLLKRSELANLSREHAELAKALK